MMLKKTGKELLFVSAILVFSVPALAVKKETLLCPGRSVMTTTVSSGGLVTVQWGSIFLVGHQLRKVHLADSDNVLLYRFQNGDLWFVDQSRQRQFFSFNGVPPLVACRTGLWDKQVPLELPYRPER
ncbi:MULTISPECIES: hypothetical protein [Enterobacteriaceae]|nr:hypothetical protein [Yokenella regensburgei]EHN8909284.1 hypothetical protein [Enterobacter hormaechei]